MILYLIISERSVYFRVGKIVKDIPIELYISFIDILSILKEFINSTNNSLGLSTGSTSSSTKTNITKIVFGTYNRQLCNDFIFYLQLVNRRDGSTGHILSMDREILITDKAGEAGIAEVRQPLSVKVKLNHLKDRVFSLRETANMFDSVHLRDLSMKMLKDIDDIQEGLRYYDK